MPMKQSGTYLDLPKGKSPEAKGSLNTRGGKDPGVPCIEKHSVKDKWFTSKVPKGQG